MLKLLVPIAHASNLSGKHQNKSFFATLCTANTIVKAPLDLPINHDAPSQASQSQDKCPLCIVAEQSESDVNITPAYKPFVGVQEEFDAYDLIHVKSHFCHLSAIRAPPAVFQLR